MDFTIRKEKLWESENATVKEVEFYRYFQPNSQTIGNNQSPLYKTISFSAE